MRPFNEADPPQTQRLSVFGDLVDGLQRTFERERLVFGTCIPPEANIPSGIPLFFSVGLTRPIVNYTID
jgi:hypothetical protein